MECNFFGLGCPVYKLRIASWNINGVTNKIERDNVISWTDDKDIIFLNKTKTSILFNVPGFYVYQDKSTGRKRGGTALLLTDGNKKLALIAHSLTLLFLTMNP